MIEPRIWLLLRRLDEEQSLFFTLRIHITEDEPAVFGATVAGFENRMAAGGSSIAEAEQNAVDMFTDLIDYSIEESRTPLSFELGPSFPFPYATVPVGLEKADEFFNAVAKAVNARLQNVPKEEWRLVPTSLLLASSAAPAMIQS